LCPYIIHKLLERAHTSTLPLAPFRTDTPLHFAPLNICSLSYSAGWSWLYPVSYRWKATRDRPGLNGSTSLASCNLTKHSGVLLHKLYVTIIKSQRHKKRMLIFIHFNPLRSFFYIRGLQTTACGANPAREVIDPACQDILQTTGCGPNPSREYIL